MKREGKDKNSCVLGSMLTDFVEMTPQTNMKNLWFFWWISNFMTHFKSIASLKCKSENLLEGLTNLKISSKEKKDLKPPKIESFL